MVAAASTRPVTTAALAARTTVRRGMADSVMRIMPVLYSLLMASTATMATTAWPRSIPVRLTLAGSTWQTTPDGQLVPAAAAAPTAAVSTIAASSSHPVLAMVRVLVHSACRASAGPVLAGTASLI